ncbi:U1 small nuclear ribonucleoprotein 70 kDa-like protein [Drosera capensis]
MGDFNDPFNRNQNNTQARTKAQNRANVLQLKMIGQSHPTGLTSSLLRLFEPRAPLEFKPPPEKRKLLPYSGMAQFVSLFVDKDDPDYAPPLQKGETPAERRARIHQLRLEAGAAKAAEDLEKYDPHNDPNVTGDPYKTLFVAKLSYETTESRLKREFETYGPIKRVKMAYDKERNKPKGYAFIEYSHTRDMKDWAESSDRIDAKPTEPRAPLEFKPPPDKRKLPPYSGMAQFVSFFADKDDPDYAPPLQKGETPAERRARIHQLRLEAGAAKAAEDLEKYDPHNDPNVTGDPYKTLFVAKLSYETTESRLKREFETYGPIKRVKMAYDKERNKPKGYAFIEYSHTRDMKAAYKQADGRKIDGRRVLVDVERGRTVPNWRPRRLGGGLGTTRVGGEDVTQRPSGREVQSGSASRSAEPKIREDREREKSKERVREREKEREKSRERSHDRPRDRDHREDKHHRDRDRTRDKERERERDHGRDRDRTHDRERGRDRGRERDRDLERDRRPRDKDRERDRDYEMEEPDHDRGRSRDRDYDYDHLEPKHDRDRHDEREHGGTEDEEGWYDQTGDGHRRSGAEKEKNYDHYGHGRGGYDEEDGGVDADRYNHHRDRDQYDPMEDS